jgi:hypothetical protein
MMRRIASALLALLLLVSAVGGARAWLVQGGSPTPVAAKVIFWGGTTASTNSNAGFAALGFTQAANDTAIAPPSAVAGTVKNLRASLGAVPSPGTYTVSFFVNGAAAGPTCVIGSASTTCSDTTTTTTVAAGDTMSIKFLGSGSPASVAKFASVDIE